MLTSDVRYFFRTVKRFLTRLQITSSLWSSISRAVTELSSRASYESLDYFSPANVRFHWKLPVLSSWNEGKTGLRWWSMTSSPWDVGKERKVARARPTFDQETNDCSHHDFALEILRALTVNDLLPSLYAYFFLQIHIVYALAIYLHSSRQVCTFCQLEKTMANIKARLKSIYQG